MVRWDSCALVYVLAYSNLTKQENQRSQLQVLWNCAGEVQWVSNSYPTGTHDQGIMSLRSSSPSFSNYYQELGELFHLSRIVCISADFAHTHPNIKGQIFAGSIQSSSLKRISYCTHYTYFKRLSINEKGFASNNEIQIL